MNMFLTLAYLFFIGSTLGWVAELLYRRFLSGANPERTSTPPAVFPSVTGSIFPRK